MKAIFNTASRNNDESFALFNARLQSVFKYYVKSRGAEDDYESLFDVMVSDRLKACLPAGALTYVLSREGDECYSSEKIAELAAIHVNKTENVDDENQVVIDDVVNNDSETSDVHLNNALTSEILSNEQAIDGSLDPCFKAARAGKRYFVIRNPLLYHNDQVLGLKVQQLCLPVDRRVRVMELAHQNHLGYKKV